MIKKHRYSLLLIGLWTVLLASWFVWFAHDEQHKMKESTLIQGRSVIEKDILYRRWNAMMGGVYVPVSETIIPNPHLAHLPDRDIITLSGKKLTLINPSYMTRMVFDLGVLEGLFSGHITSLNPLRPENRADAWEAEALQELTHGGKEVFAEKEREGARFMRVMSPLITEEGCLKCHGSQGYKVGDVRGGISVKVPMQQYQNTTSSHIRAVGLSVSSIWLLGCFGIFIINSFSAEKRRYFEKSANEWKTTFDSMSDFVSVHDEDFRFVNVNKALAAFLNKTPQELVGKKCFEEIHCTEEPHPNCPLEETQRTGKPVTREIENKQMGMPLLVSTSPIIDLKGTLSGYVHIAKDMTDIIKTQEALQESEIRYRTLFEQAPLGYQSLDVNGCFLEVNDAWLDLFGYKKEEVIGRSFGDFVDPEFRSDFVDNFQTVKANCEILGVELEMVKKDGSKILVAINGNIGVDNEGNFKRTHCILHNITEERHRQEKLVQYRDELEQKVEERTWDLEEAHRQLILTEKLAAIGQLSGSVAHDIRNPLGSISNSIYFLERILGATIGEKVQKHISIMGREIERANDTITDLLDFSRENSPVMVNAHANREIITLLKDFNVPENIIVETELAPDLPLLHIDVQQIRRVFHNLIVNGLQAMGDGGLLRISSRRSGGGCIEVAVQDSGTGIVLENIEYIFDPLFTTKSKGVGLGLTIAKDFVEKHNGEIHVESKVGLGTVFKVRLPITNEASAESKELR